MIRVLWSTGPSKAHFPRTEGPASEPVLQLLCSLACLCPLVALVRQKDYTEWFPEENLARVEPTKQPEDNVVCMHGAARAIMLLLLLFRPECENMFLKPFAQSLGAPMWHCSNSRHTLQYCNTSQT